jgi:hypothetical protein
MKKTTIKNPYGKMVRPENAYAVYGNDPRLPGWEWRILKTYQTPKKAEENKYARAFCLVTSPMTGPSGDLGDTYLSDIGGELISGTDIRGGGIHALRADLGMGAI